MSMNNEIPEEVPKETRDGMDRLDKLNTKILIQYPEGTSPAAETDAVSRIRDADEFLSMETQEFESKEEFEEKYSKVLRALDVAMLTTNEPYAHDLRKNLIEKFGPPPLTTPRR